MLDSVASFPWSPSLVLMTSDLDTRVLTYPAANLFQIKMLFVPRCFRYNFRLSCLLARNFRMQWWAPAGSVLSILLVVLVLWVVGFSGFVFSEMGLHLLKMLWTGHHLSGSILSFLARCLLSFSPIHRLSVSSSLLLFGFLGVPLFFFRCFSFLFVGLFVCVASFCFFVICTASPCSRPPWTSCVVAR